MEGAKKPIIVFENDDLLVIDKPFGMIVNNADTTRAHYTVQDWVEETVKMFPPDDFESEFVKRAGIVHRIDKETSGALIIAKNEETFVAIQKQFKEKTVEKTYTALCHGEVLPKEGTIHVPVGRLPWNRQKFGVIADGRESLTDYRVERTYQTQNGEVLSLVHAFPKTGRTHQIRVHMRYLGFPIFADILYAGRKNSKRDRKLLARHFLHASKIIFQNPRSNETLTVESPLPQELVAFLATLS